MGYSVITMATFDHMVTVAIQMSWRLAMPGELLAKCFLLVSFVY